MSLRGILLGLISYNMRMIASTAGLLVGSIALTLLAACTTETQPVPSPQDWPTAYADGFDGYGFSLRLPPSWQLRKLQGVDSYVGEIVGDGVRFTFDYGIYSNQLPYEDDPAYTVMYAEIGGREAKLVRPKEGVEEIPGVYFENF